MAERDVEYEAKKAADFLEYSRRHIDGGGLLLSPVCRRCRHQYDVLARTCAAFPRVIPAEIWNGENDHTTPFPGDHGILFAPVETSEADCRSNCE